MENLEKPVRRQCEEVRRAVAGAEDLLAGVWAALEEQPADHLAVEQWTTWLSDCVETARTSLAYAELNLQLLCAARERLDDAAAPGLAAAAKTCVDSAAAAAAAAKTAVEQSGILNQAVLELGADADRAAGPRW
jgi:hypothetical protein